MTAIILFSALSNFPKTFGFTNLKVSTFHTTLIQRKTRTILAQYLIQNKIQIRYNEKEVEKNVWNGALKEQKKIIYLTFKRIL